MKFAGGFLVFLVLPAAGLALVNVGSEQDSKSPVARVVDLLTDIKAQLEKEAASDSETYDEQVCWCKTNEEDKTAAIAAADSKISNLEAAMGSHSGQDATLDVQIADMKVQIAADEKALKEATAIREQEAATFSTDEKQMITDISNLKNAIEVLSKHHESSAFMQDASPIDVSLRTVLRDISARYEIIIARKSQKSRPILLDVKAHNVSAVATPNPATALLSILGGTAAGSVLPVDIAARELAASAGNVAKASTFMQAKGPGDPATHLEKYSSQSNEVWGILNTMLKDFEADLSQEQKDELKAREAYEALSASKTEQIKLGKAHLDQLQEEAAVNSKALADSKEDLALTREQRSTDVEFLSNLRLTCQNLDSEWAERSNTRSEELQAITEALAILREDDNREQLAKSISFLQQGSHHRTITVDDGSRLRSTSVKHERSLADLAERAMRSKAAAALRHAARGPGMDLSDLLQAWHGRSGNESNAGSHSDRLAILAVSAELDSFTEVKKAIDQMIADLQAEQKEEVETKDSCETEFRENDKATYAKTEEQKDLAAQIENLEGKMAKLQAEIDAANAEIEATKKSLKEAGEDRKKEVQEFQATIADQRAAQDILTQTLKRLEAFYKTQQEESAALVQKKASAKQTPPVQFNDYKKNVGAKSVMSFIQLIINDSKKLENEATAAATAAQATFEDYVKSCRATTLQLQQTVVATTKSLAQATQDKEQAETEHSDATSELEDLSLTKSDLHGSCDFLLKNFDLRQKARLEEVEALHSAKSILSGAR